MSRLAVIPARGGSKRIPKKNVRPMLEKPLIAYTIEAALESAVFDRIVVSTDDPEIAETARSFGAEIPFLRAAGLADDVTPVSAATLDAVEKLQAGDDDVAQLMANCPLRTADDIRDSYRVFTESGAESQISVTRYGWLNPWWALRRTPENRIEPMFEDRVTQRSQDLPELFCPTGAIWWARIPVLRREGTFHVPGRTGWEIRWQHAVDIDTSEDWELAELLMRARSREHATLG